MKKITLSILLLLTIMIPQRVNANTLGTSITGNTSVTAGNRFTLTFAITNAVNAQGIQSKINFNTNHFSIVSATNLISNTSGGFTTSNNSYVASWTQYLSGTISFVRIEFQTRPGFTPGTTSPISMNNTFVTQGNPPKEYPESGSGLSRSVTITSVAPLSTTNTLSSISINGTNLSNFSSSTLNYTLPNTTADSITINAVRTDSKSTLTGTGTFGLSYGTNRFSLNVRSESGSTRTYTISVNRPDLRGDNTNIKSVTIGDQVLTWNDDKTLNTLLLPHSLAQAVLKIELSESSSTITTSLTHDLVVGDNKINITVTSEKGSSQTHVLTLVRADDQNNFPETYTSTQLKHVLIDGIIYQVNQGMIRLPYSIIEPEIKFVPVSQLTKVTSSEIAPFEFGDNIVDIELSAFDGSKETITINFFREDQMFPVSFEELLANIDDYPVETLSFFYEGMITEEDILSILLSTNKSFRVYVRTSSMLGFWSISSEDALFLKDLDLSIEENNDLAFQEQLGFVIQSNIIFKETSFPKPVSFTFIELSSLSDYETLYGYQFTEAGLVLLESWEVLPLTSTINVGGPLHIVISPAMLIAPPEPDDGFDIRYIYALGGGLVVGWLLFFISVIRNMRLKRKLLKLKKGVI